MSGVNSSGYANIALIEFCLKHNLRPDCIIGCSTGAFIAAMWAKGLSLEEIYTYSRQHHHLLLNKKFDFDRFFSFSQGFYDKSRAFYNVDRVKQLLDRIFHHSKIEDLIIPTIIQTTNIDSCLPYEINSGLVREAVYASAAMLPFYPAQKIGDQWLGEGAFTTPVPISTVFKNDYRTVLVSAPELTNDMNAKSFMAYYSNFLQKTMKLINASKNTINIYLQDNDLIIIPILFKKEKMLGFDELISVAQSEFNKHTDLILEKISQK